MPQNTCVQPRHRAKIIKLRKGTIRNRYFTYPLKTHDPRVYFIVFLVSNALLAYGHLSFLVKVWIGLMGVVLPLVLAFLNIRLLQKKRTDQEKSWQVPSWIWAGILFGSIFLRFYGLTSLPTWPMWDDADFAFYSLQLFEHWKWRLFFASTQVPPLFFWLQALFFKIIHPSLMSLWLFPALVSALSVPMAYWASRQFFTPFFSMLLTALVGFSFWPLYLEHFCLPVILLLEWQFLCLGLLGCYWKVQSVEKNRLPTWALGFGAAAGFYIGITWIPTFLILLGSVAWRAWVRKPRDFTGFYVFLACQLAVLPLMRGFFANLFQGHLVCYLVFGAGASQNQWVISLSYLTALFWGSLDRSYFNFGPLWGGFLNPLLGSAFFVGILVLIQRRLWFQILGLFLAGLLFLLPGLVSTTLEMMRIFQILPLLLLVTAWGIESLLQKSPRPWRIPLFMVLLSSSFALDAYHLLGPYHQWAVPGPYSMDSKSPERYRAFQILDQVQSKEGPGLILTEFVPNIFDQSLLIATYPFNAARNHRLNPLKVRWAAVLADDSFRPYFSRHFPRCQSYPLFGGLPAVEGNLTLFLFPLDSSTWPFAEKWLEAHRQIQDLYGLMPYHTALFDYGPALQMLESCRPFFEGDLFLESFYWEKRTSLESQDRTFGQQIMQGLEKEIQVCGKDPALKRRQGFFWQRLGDSYEKLGQGDRLAVGAYSRAFQAGYESPHLYTQLLQAELRLGDYRRAFWALRQAWRLDPKNPPPSELVQWLQDKLRSSGKKTAAP